MHAANKFSITEQLDRVRELAEREKAWEHKNDRQRRSRRMYSISSRTFWEHMGFRLVLKDSEDREFLTESGNRL